ncbi:SseB family protein [Streptomyces albus subsp. chlorinus]|uniref:SseB family protein n=1 Tax=Streptomyces albus TaxID=1888 RepID=UPI00156E56DF|nr:SseB family protein [Streptomyces albus]NSC22803.1 SseB family protein [Streptomyces albus subsp. chlorinus]
MYGYDQTGASPGQGHGAHGYQDVGPHPQQGHHQAPPPPYGARQGAPYGQPGPQQQPFYPEPSPPSLKEAIRAFTTGSMSAEDFQGVFSTSKVYCPRGDTPGFLALHNTQQPVIPMFSTLKELRAYAGKESKYFVITGAEVLDLLPSGYGFVLDMEGEHRVVFDAKAVEEMVDFAMRRMYG